MISRRSLIQAAVATPLVLRSASAQGTGKITIATLPGLGYAPLTLAKQGRWLEQAVPGLRVNWVQIASSAAIREGMLSGDIDVGAGSVAPFLIGRDRGFKVGIVSAMTVMDLLLLTNDPAVKSIADLDSSRKIAVTAPDTNQAFVLRMAAKEKFGDAKALDGSFLAMPHPDALQALLTNQISAYMGSPPFQEEAVARGCRVLLRSRDVAGALTFGICFALAAYGAKEPENLRALRQAITRGIELLNTNPGEAAKMLSADSGGRQSEAEIARLLGDKDTAFNDKLIGVPKLAEFMRATGFIRGKVGDDADLLLKG